MRPGSWVDHVEFGDVSSRIQEVMERLFYPLKLHFAAWVWLHEIEQSPCPRPSPSLWIVVQVPKSYLPLPCSGIDLLFTSIIISLVHHLWDPVDPMNSYGYRSGKKALGCPMIFT